MKTGGIAQENLEIDSSRLRLGLNMRIKFENPGLQKSDFDYKGSPSLRSLGGNLMLQFFIAHRINQRWHINYGLGYFSSQIIGDATYSIDDIDREIRLLGELKQNLFSFSLKAEYWINQSWYLNSGPAFNFVLWNSYDNRARDSRTYFIERDWVSDQTSFIGWQSNVGALFPLGPLKIQGNIGYLWGSQSVGGRITPNLIHNVFTFGLGIVSGI